MNELSKNLVTILAVTGALSVRHAVTIANPDADRIRPPYKDVTLHQYHDVTLEEAQSIKKEFIKNNPELAAHNLKFRWTSWKDL